MSDEPTQNEPNGDEPEIQLPPTQFLMFPEGFRAQRTQTPIGDCLALTGMAMGVTSHVEATLMIPVEQVDALCELCKAQAQPPSGLVQAAADTDLAELARQARERSGL